MSDLHIPTSTTSISSLTQAKSDLAVSALHNAATKDHASKIDKAAHDFESIMVGQWLEKAEKSFATVPGSDPDQSQDSSRDQYQSIACESLARGLSKAGGFGIASMISKHLAASAAKYAESGGSQASSDPPKADLEGAKLKNSK